MLTSQTPTGRSFSRRFAGIIQRSFMLLISLSLLTSAMVAQDKRDLPPLELGVPIERELSGDAAHSYSLSLATNQFLHIVVDQKGIDVIVTLFAPDGNKLAEVDSPNGTQGPEPVSVVVKAAGSYRLEIRSPDAKAAAGRYQVKLEEIRTATSEDKSRIAAQQAAQKAYEEGEHLQEEGSADSLRKAIVRFQEALPFWRSINDRAREGASVNNIGLAYNSLGEKEKALDFFNQALSLIRIEGDRSGEATVLASIGSVYETLGEKQKALDFYIQSLPVKHEVGDIAGEGLMLHNIGTIYDSLGEKQKALDFFNRALPLLRTIGERLGEAHTLTQIGAVYDTLGEKKKALAFYAQALPLFRAIGDRSGEALALHNIAVAYDGLGDKQKALEFNNQALTIRRAVGDRHAEAASLNNIGLIYDSLGEPKKALDHYNQALPIFRSTADFSGEASTLNNIGNAYDMLGEKQKGLSFYIQALNVARASGDHGREASTLNNIGMAYVDLGDYEKALTNLNQALPLFREDSDHRGEAYALTNIGVVYAFLGDKSKALDLYNQALPIRRAVRDRFGEAVTFSTIASVERDRGNLSEARARIEDALVIIEDLRIKITSKELRASYLATVQRIYDLYIDILMLLHKQQPSAGHDGKALQLSERGRARSLLETLAEANADIRQGVDPTLLERERAVQERLNAKAQEQARLLNGQHTQAQADAVAREVEGLSTEFQQIESEIRQKSPNYAALTQPEPLSLKQIQNEVLDKDTLLLEYSLGEEHSYLWAVTPTSITSYQLPKRDEIEALARQVYALLRDSKQWKTRAAGRRQLTLDETKQVSAQETIAKLSQMLLAPVAAQLGKKRLLIIADGALQYIPFGALPAPSEQGSGGRGRGSAKESSSRPQSPGPRPPLIVDHEIVSLPSASTLAVLRKQVKDRQPAPKSVAVLADPVFESNDARVALAIKRTNGAVSHKASGSTTREMPLGLERSAEESGLRVGDLKIPRLPGTRVEARQILALIPPSQSKEAFDFSANRQTAMSDELSQYRYIHFATHGILNSVHPELSGLVFSMVDEKGQPQDGFLRAHEIFNLQLPAELVVLSACQTGLGKEIKGEGLVGLTRGFMYAGSPRVVVSLWSVSDQATAELMTRFYRGMLKEKLRPAAALRAAQVSLMKEKKWESPFYWAAFKLQGEWR